MEFKLSQSSQVRGDCTASYDVTIIGNGTVGEFIDAVLEKCSKEWGYIGICSTECSFGKPAMEYKHGKAINREEMSDFESKQVKSVVADGGWSRMDYVIQLA